MRLEYKVTPSKSGWCVQRGFTEALRFDAFDQALRAAETLARSAADAGDTGVVKVIGHDLAASKIFNPQPSVGAGTRFDPEGDQARRAMELAHARI